MASNDALLDGAPDRQVRREAGVNERGKDQLNQGGRGFYDGAFDGSTPIGAAKGNRPFARETVARPLTSSGPFKNLRGGHH